VAAYEGARGWFLVVCFGLGRFPGAGSFGVLRYYCIIWEIPLKWYSRVARGSDEKFRTAVLHPIGYHQESRFLQMLVQSLNNTTVLSGKYN
jgi:hypothetical protein